MLGGELNVADLLLKTCLDWAGFVQIQIPASLEPYSAALASRKAYGVAMTKNFTPAAMAALVGTQEEE
jgi:hypothetical protein